MPKLSEEELREHLFRVLSGHAHNDRATEEMVAAVMSTITAQDAGSVILEVIAERQAQDAKWGEQNHPDGTGPDVEWTLAALTADYAARLARNEVHRLMSRGGGGLTWLAIMHEEMAEAFAESDVAKLRTELVQVAAVAVAWVEAIDRR